MFKQESYYETSDYFYEPFWEFKSKIDSLQRLVILTSWNISWYLKNGSNKQIVLWYEIDPKEVEELLLTDSDFGDPDGFLLDEKATDNDRFNKYFYWSIIASLLSLLETLLQEVVKDMSDWKLENPQDSYIQKYIDILRKDYWLEINITRADSDRLYKVRKIRNEYIHSLWSEYAEIVSKWLEDISIKEKAMPYNLELVDFAFDTISNIVSKLEDWCLKYNGKK